MAINQRINEIVKIKKYSNDYMGNQIGVSKNTISNFRNGKTDPSTKFLIYLVKEHPGLNLNWLLLGEGNMFKNENSNEIKQLNRIEKLEKKVAILEKGNDQAIKDYKRILKSIKLMGEELDNLANKSKK